MGPNRGPTGQRQIFKMARNSYRRRRGHLQIREADSEIQEMLRWMKKEGAITLQADDLQQKLVAMREREEDLRRLEAALTRRMAIEKQRGRRGNGAASVREDDFRWPRRSESPPGVPHFRSLLPYPLVSSIGFWLSPHILVATQPKSLSAALHLRAHAT